MATQAEVNQMRVALDQLASNIAGDLTNLAATETEIAAKEMEIENATAARMSDIANERFAANNQLRYTNDVQRKAALVEAQIADANFQQFVIARRTAIQAAAGARALIEQQRKEFRAQELVLLWHANNPAA